MPYASRSLPLPRAAGPHHSISARPLPPARRPQASACRRHRAALGRALTWRRQVRASAAGAGNARKGPADARQNSAGPPSPPRAPLAEEHVRRAPPRMRNEGDQNPALHYRREAEETIPRGEGSVSPAPGMGPLRYARAFRFPPVLQFVTDGTFLRPCTGLG